MLGRGALAGILFALVAGAAVAQDAVAPNTASNAAPSAAPSTSETYVNSDPDHLLPERLRKILDGLRGAGRIYLLDSLQVASEPVAVGDTLFSIRFEHKRTGVIVDDYRTTGGVGGNIAFAAGTRVYATTFSRWDGDVYGLSVQRAWCAVSFTSQITRDGSRGACIFGEDGEEVRVFPLVGSQHPYAATDLDTGNVNTGPFPHIAEGPWESLPEVRDYWRLRGISRRFIDIGVVSGDEERRRERAFGEHRRNGDSAIINLLGGMFEITAVDNRHARVAVLRAPTRGDTTQDYAVRRTAEGFEATFGDLTFVGIGDRLFTSRRTPRL